MNPVAALTVLVVLCPSSSAIAEMPSGRPPGGAQGKGGKKTESKYDVAEAMRLQNAGMYRSASDQWSACVLESTDATERDLAFLNLGICLYKMKDYDRAAVVLWQHDEEFKESPRLRESLSTLAAVQLRRAMRGSATYCDAAEAARRAYQANKETELGALLMLQWSSCLYKSEKPDEGHDVIEEFLKQEDSDSLASKAAFQMALSEKQAGRRDEEAKALDMVLERWPTSTYAPQCHLNRGVLFLHAGEFSHSADHFRSASQSQDFASADTAMAYLGLSLERAGKAADAMETYNALKNRFPKSKHAAVADAALTRLKSDGSKSRKGDASSP